MDQFSTNYFIVLCGIPGSGKSTLSNQLAKTYNARLYSYDEILRASKIQDSHRVHSQILALIAEDLRNGINVVLDDLNIRIDVRTEVLATTKDIDCNKVLVVMNTPLNECLLRNANRKKRLPDWAINLIYRKYQQPSLAEGWDDIWHY